MTTKVQVYRRPWGTEMVSVGLRIIHDNVATQLYDNICPRDEVEKVQKRIDIANSTAVCCVMALGACGIDADLETVD